MLKKIIISSFVFLISFVHANEPTQGLGFAAGHISGLGISYRIMGEKYGFQATFGGISQKYDDDDFYFEDFRKPFEPDYWQPSTEPFTRSDITRETDFNVGLMLIKVLHSAQWSTFYAFGGATVFMGIESIYEYRYQNTVYEDNTYEQIQTGGPYKKSSTSSTIYGGAGIGIEIKFTRNLHLAIEWPLTISSEGDFIMYIPQTGLHYFF